MRMVLLLLGLLAALLAPASALAHPLGNFTTSHYARAELSGANVYVPYVLDMAEIPTLRERDAIEAAGGPGPYARMRALALADDLTLWVDDRRLVLVPVSQVARLLPGQAGLTVLRLAVWYRAPGAPSLGPGPHAVTVRDGTYPDRIGWREVVVRATSGARVEGPRRRRRTRATSCAAIRVTF